MTDISNHNKKAKFPDVLSPSIWPDLPQALASKMPAKKREPWKPKEHSRAFQRSLRRESIQVSTLPVWPAGADCDGAYPTAISLFTAGGASDLSPAELREGSENSQYQG